MNLILKISLVCFTLLLSQSFTFSQQNELTKKYKEEIIHTLSSLIVENYVSEEIGLQTKDHLMDLLDKGHFKQFKNDTDFAVALTNSVRSINKDKHMTIRERPPFEAPDESPERMIEEQLHHLERSRTYNGGFNSVKVLEGNVGYLDLRGFAYFRDGKGFADAFMKLIENTDAIIIDLSKNGGGDPEMVKYLCSYFLENDIHINSLYFREGNRTIDFHTSDVDGKKLVDIPLFVITGKKTFSGAEEFSYNMQTQKRATLIGETTGGGANPGGLMPLNESLEVFIPTGKAINPITKTNWEGIGVVPEIKKPIEDAFQTAHELAKIEAIKFKETKNNSYKEIYHDLLDQLDNYSENDSETEIINLITKCHKLELLNEWTINLLGYDYLSNPNTLNAGALILKTNTVLFPNYANGFDSYGEALFKLGKKEESIFSYQKAIEIAKETNDPQLSLYEENLKKVIGEE